jgi:hypothetical protein
MTGADGRHRRFGQAGDIDQIGAFGKRAVHVGCPADRRKQGRRARPATGSGPAPLRCVHGHTPEHGTIRSVPVILFLAAAAILGCVVLAALGMAGEMAMFPSDSAPLRMSEVTAADVALLRPPLALWGYSVPATEEALGVIARAVTARDAEIATLRQELNDMRSQWHPSEQAAPPQQAAPPLRAARPQRAAPPHDEVPAWPAVPEPGSGE